MKIHVPVLRSFVESDLATADVSFSRYKDQSILAGPLGIAPEGSFVAAAPDCTKQTQAPRPSERRYAGQAADNACDLVEPVKTGDTGPTMQ